MPSESPFVDAAIELIRGELEGEPLEVQRGAPLLYQVTVDNRLRVMEEGRIKAPRRGESAW